MVINAKYKTGSYRNKRKFLLFPKRFDNKIYWLEWVLYETMLY